MNGGWLAGWMEGFVLHKQKMTEITLMGWRKSNSHSLLLIYNIFFFQREKENIMDHKRQVKHLVAKSKTIVRLKPRYPEEKNSSGIIVKALTDYKQDQVTFMILESILYKYNT